MSESVTCQTCQRQSTAVPIGTSTYCALCGSRVEEGSDVTATAAPVAVAPATPKPRSLDFQRGNAPVVSARGTTAHKLHNAPQRASKHTLDLRDAKPKASKPRGSVYLPGQTPLVPANAPAQAPAGAPQAMVTAPAPAPVPPPQPAIIKSNTTKIDATTRDPRHRTHDATSLAARHERAKTVSKSQHVSRFGSANSRLTAPEPVAEVSPQTPTLSPRPATDIAIPAAAVAAHRQLSKLVPKPEATEAHRGPKWQHYAGVAAAVAVMAGYIWLENYPKLSLQAAAAKAGVAATNPSYLPTSFSLSRTTAQPGVLTLSFKSPSQSDTLTIAQQRTTWDAKSLADNYVAENDPTYSAVHGQGLTIYLFNKNQAAWVNHGVWYTIKGTARLSRDQVLQIAYGL